MTSQAKLVLQDLQTRYKKATLSKKELAHELSLSYATIDRRMKQGIGIPNYRKIGKAKNARVVFNIIDVAIFLSNTVKVA